MQSLTDDVIIMASQGDMKSFEAIYASLSGFVYNVAFGIVNNREDAQEVSQEVFLSVYNKLKDFRFRASLKTWVYRITVNYAINFAKKKSRISARTSEYADGLTESGQKENPEAVKKMDIEYNSKIAEKMLGEINPEQRACVVLRDREGLSYEDISKTLGVNINTVRSRLKRAREKFMAIVKRRGHDEL